MSHIGVRIVANWLADATYGVNAIAAVVPRDGSDPQPDAVHVYDETRHGWVARNEAPRGDGVVQFPAVAVVLQKGQFDGAVPDSQDTGARTVDGQITVIVQLLLQKSATETAVAQAMYLVRAIRNSLLQLNDPSRDAQRTLTGIRLTPTDGVLQGRLDAPVGDNVLAAAALMVTYATTEVTALTLDVN